MRAAFLPQTSTSTKTVLPLVIDDSLISQFKYWNQGICAGMRYNRELYTHFQFYQTHQRLEAYSAGCEQAERGASVCITVSKQGYSVWLSLRSLSQAAENNSIPMPNAG